MLISNNEFEMFKNMVNHRSQKIIKECEKIKKEIENISLDDIKNNDHEDFLNKIVHKKSEPSTFKED